MSSWTKSQASTSSSTRHRPGRQRCHRARCAALRLRPPLDLVILTHAHADPCGLSVRLYREGFEGLVYATAETRRLATLVMLDGAKHNPCYDAQDVARIRWSTHAASATEVPVGRVVVRFFRAGHILGATSVQIWWGSLTRRQSILFSGDLGPTSSSDEYHPLLRPRAVLPVFGYCAIESTDGGRRRSAEERPLAARPFGPRWSADRAGALERLARTGGGVRRMDWRARDARQAPRVLTVQATIVGLSGYSAHAQQRDLLDWLMRVEAPGHRPSPRADASSSPTVSSRHGRRSPRRSAESSHVGARRTTSRSLHHR
jgi:Cft2 family RNA processing exonuclease